MVIKLFDAHSNTFTQYGIYDESHCLRLTDLLPDNQLYQTLQLKQDAPAGGLCRVHKVESLGVLYRKVVLELLRQIIDDLIENANHYKLPTSGGARWRVLSKPRPQIRSIAKRNKYQFVDLDKSYNRIYELVMEYRAYGKLHKRIIRVDMARYRHLCALVEKGRHYDLK